MRSLAQKTAALAACFLLMSCTSLPPAVIAPPRPLPADLAQLCPRLPPLPNPNADAMAAALKELYDVYGICAGRVADLLDWLDGGQ